MVKIPINDLEKGICFLRDDKTVIRCDDDGYQIYSVSPSNIQLGQALLEYYLSRLNKF